MTILLIEDDRKKATQVAACLARARPNSHVEERRSFQSGLRYVLDNPPSILVLDMTLPTYDLSLTEPGGRPRSFAGREIIAEIAREGLRVAVIVVTGFDSFGEGAARITIDQLKDRLRTEFPQIYVGMVQYDASGTRWTIDLDRLIVRAEERLIAWGVPT